MKTDPLNCYHLKKITHGTVSKGDMFPLTCAITFTPDCGHCDWAVCATGGTKLHCTNPRILAKRPYIDDPKGNGRVVEADKRPEWCPL